MHSSRIQEKVKDDYDMIAKDFADTRKFPWADFDIFLKYYKNDYSVLDLGCGNGRLLNFLNKHGFKEYLGVDQSNELLKIAKKEFDVNFELGDISNLNLDKKFDCIFAIASFHHLPPKDQLETLRDWGDLLKGDSYLFMTNWNLHQPRYLGLLLRSLLSPTFGLRGVLVPWQDKVKRYYFSFTKRRIQKLLKKAGYNVLYNEYVNNGVKSSMFNGKNILTIAQK